MSSPLITPSSLKSYFALNRCEPSVAPKRSRMPKMRCSLSWKVRHSCSGPGVDVAVGVFVGTPDGVLVAVAVFVGVLVGPPAGVVFVAVGVFVGAIGVFVAVAVLVGVSVGTPAGVVFVAVGVLVGGAVV